MGGERLTDPILDEVVLLSERETSGVLRPIGRGSCLTLTCDHDGRLPRRGVGGNVSLTAKDVLF